MGWQGTVYYSYGAVGRMEYVLDGKTGKATYYEYDPAGRATMQGHPNGAMTYFSYDLGGGSGMLSAERGVCLPDGCAALRVQSDLPKAASAR